MSLDHVRQADERTFREAVAALIRSAEPLRPEKENTERLAAMLREVRTLAELGADAPLEQIVRPAHRAVHAYRPVCVDAAADGQVQPGDGPVFIAWSRLHEALHRLEETAGPLSQ
jgi:hypothetical protein